MPKKNLRGFCAVSNIFTYIFFSLICFVSAKLILKTSSSVCPLSAGSVVLATLNILATTKMDIIATQHKLMTSLASDVMALIEFCQSSDKVRNQNSLGKPILTVDKIIDSI